MKKLLLIKPVHPHYGRSLRNRGAGVPPVALGILAALTPKDWQVRISDENFAPFEQAEADLVGLTAFTNTAPRAYGYFEYGLDVDTPAALRKRTKLVKACRIDSVGC
jgi:hypothetical protein